MSHSGSFYIHTESSSRRTLEIAAIAFVKPLLAFILSIACSSILQYSASAQSKPLKEIRVLYALGGSTSLFWVAHRSGSFEKHGVKVLPIFMRGGREAVQALISRDVSMLQQGSAGVILAWAQGAKDLVVIGAAGNKLDYILVSTPNIKSPARPEGEMHINGAEGNGWSFLKQLEEERRAKR